jgi:hypothetical protein
MLGAFFNPMFEPPNPPGSAHGVHCVVVVFLDLLDARINLTNCNNKYNPVTLSHAGVIERESNFPELLGQFYVGVVQVVGTAASWHSM